MNDHVIDGMPFLSPAIKALLFSAMLWARQPSFRAIDDDFPQLRLLSQYFVQLLCLARWTMQGDQLAHDGCQLPNPFTDLALSNAKEQPHQILGRIGLVVEKDEKQFLFGTDQTALSSATRLR